MPRLANKKKMTVRGDTQPDVIAPPAEPPAARGVQEEPAETPKRKRGKKK